MASAPNDLRLDVCIGDENNPLLSPQYEDEEAEVVPLSADINDADSLPLELQDDLIEAMQQNNFAQFENLLYEVNFSTLSSAPYFLASACWCDDGRYINAALKAGINPNTVIKDGIIIDTYMRLRDHAINANRLCDDHRRRDRRAVHIAAGSDNFKVLRVLLEHQYTDKQAVDSYGDTWLHYFARKPYTNSSGDKKSSNNYSQEFLQRQESKQIANVQNKINNTFMHVAALHFHHELVETALRNDSLGLDVNLKNGKKETALHLLARSTPQEENENSSQMSCIKLLIKKGIDINAENKQKSTALHIAAINGNYLVMRALLSNQDMDICSKDNDQYTAFHRLALNNNMSDECMLWCTRMFYKLDTLDVNAVGASGRTPLHLSSQSGNFVMFKELTRHSAIQIKKKDKIERTVIHYLSSKRENKSAYNIRKLLNIVLNKGVDINAQDTYGQTALHIATMEHFSEMIYVLLDHGAEILTKNRLGKSVVDIIEPRTLETYMNMCTGSSAQPHENDFEIKYNYRFLLSNMKDTKESSCCVESSVTYALSTSRHLQYLLCHPLVMSFLYLKWQKWRYILFAHVILYVILMACVNVCIIVDTVTTSACFNNTEINNCTKNSATEEEVTSSWTPTVHYILPILAFFFLAKLLISLIVFRVKYSLSQTYILELFVCVSSFYFIFCYWFGSSINMYMSLATIIISWFQLILLTGSLPLFSVNLEMLKGVLKTFIQYFSWYFIIITGFALSFFILFYNGKNKIDGQFENPWSSILQTVLMMTGQGDPSQLTTEYMPLVSGLVVFLFVIIIVVVLLNLLSGLAIGDTGVIREQAQFLSQKSMVKFVYMFEVMLKNSQGLCCLDKLRNETQLVQNLVKKDHGLLFIVKPNMTDFSSSYFNKIGRFCRELTKIQGIKRNFNLEFDLLPLNEDIIEATKEVLQGENTTGEKISALETKINNIYDISFQDKLNRMKHQ